MKKSLIMSFLLFFIYSTFYLDRVSAETWVDKDGDSFIKIDGGRLSIFSTNSFYYFDELFTAVRKGSLLRLCLGRYKGTGLASDCLGLFKPKIGFNNQGKNRSLHFDVSDYNFVLESFESALDSNATMKLSINDKDLFSAYELNKHYSLNSHALNVLKLPD